ncbi:MAG TPA: hypothetical protein VEB19_14645 [Gemmatimonadaceae bacterium]|nr:hypothetical protein [Gemmatimonadaceae bacterium]
MTYRGKTRALGCALALTTLVACLPTATAPEPALIGEGMPVLFIGNSHTFVHDVPGIFQALADSAGGSPVAVMTVAAPSYALIDHWNDGSAAQQIRRRQWTFVVLQQGWTPAGVCRDTLILAARLFAAEVQKAGARLAMYQVWGANGQPGQTTASIESYRIASQEVGALLLPAAAAWASLPVADQARLYMDGIHASPEGAYFTALVMYRRILGTSVVGLPATLRTRIGVDVVVPPARAALMQHLADSVATTPDATGPGVSPPVITSRC